MIKIFVSPSCSSCRKVKEWFDNEKIPYRLINILSPMLTKDDIKEMISKSLDGTDEVISKRSNVIKENKIDLDTLTFSELIDFIYKNPTCLKRPIIVDDNRIQVGYNSEEIRVFIPREKRILLYKTKTNFDVKPLKLVSKEKNKIAS